MSKETGYFDKYGNDICVGDIVAFRCKNFSLSGKGIVFKDEDGEYLTKDIRKYPECKSRNEGRIYPFYDDALYTVLKGDF